MRSFSVATFIVTLSLLATGCTREAAKPPDGPPSEKGPFATRLAAALTISNVTSKDDAISRVALDAAEAGDGEVTTKAISAISNVQTKDAAASRAALKLAKASRGEEANAVARMISNIGVRDQTLAKLAKGELGE